MKNIKKFEEIDYLSSLKKDKELRDDQFSSELDVRSKAKKTDYLDTLISDKEKRQKESDIIEQRENIVHVLVQALIASDQNRDGFQNFKSDVEKLLLKYPTEKLPKVVNRYQNFQ